MVDYILPNILYCEKKRWIPVVDMQSYDNEYSRTREENIWDFFYQQPGNVSLNEAFTSKKIVLRECIPGWWGYFRWNPRDIFDYGRNQQRFYEIWSTYFKLNKEISQEFDKIFCKLISDDSNILGCSFRGTDYLENKPYGHYVQPSIEQGICAVKEMMQKNRCKKLIVSTEDAQIYEAYQNEFGKNMIALNDNHYTSAKELWKTVENSKNAKHEVYKYLLSKYIIAKCNYFIGGINGGTMTILGMNRGRFKETYFFRLGKYER